MSEQYYFAMSSGEYSDYGVGGFFVSDHQITKEDFHKFLQEQEQIENKLLAEKGYTRNYAGADYNSTTYYTDDDPNFVAFSKGLTLLESMGSREERFVKLHNLQKVEYTELWYDY